jgi:glutamate synthase (NADPH/NADH) small chain
MGEPRGFLKYPRVEKSSESVSERIGHYREFERLQPEEEMRRQGARCMDCGIPFCHSGCPLGNYIPEWNDQVYRGWDQDAVDKLHQTNNFPEITGRVCPAPCETACVAGINEPAVSIKQIELHIAEKAFEQQLVAPKPPVLRTGHRVAVVGSGPAGLAAAMELNHAGYTVTVFERDDQFGGLLRYGIPDFKLEKWVIDRRLEQMRREGVQFVANAELGRQVPASTLIDEFHASLLACGTPEARELSVPGRELRGIHLAMDFLTQQNRRVAGQSLPDEQPLSAKGKRVVVIGGGDTGSDCVGTAIRQGARSVAQLEILPQPPRDRTPHNPWPQWPNVMRTSSSQAEGCERQWSVSTSSFVGRKGVVTGLRALRVEWERNALGRLTMHEVKGTEFTIEADMVLLALGFVGQQNNSLVKQLGLELDEGGNIATDERMATSMPKVFAAGDMRRGQSLVVWAIDEGRRAAAHIARYLSAEYELN